MTRTSFKVDLSTLCGEDEDMRCQAMETSPAQSADDWGFYVDTLPSRRHWSAALLWCSLTLFAHRHAVLSSETTVHSLRFHLLLLLFSIMHKDYPATLCYYITTYITNPP
jgi:hypothetical protein